MWGEMLAERLITGYMLAEKIDKLTDLFRQPMPLFLQRIHLTKNCAIESKGR